MAEQEYRIESDTIGEVKIPKEALWGPQTERSRNNFPSGELMPLAIIRAFLHLKKAAAESNVEVGDEPAEKGQAIEEAIDQLLALSDEDLRKDFPLHVLQTGSGTQTNMNVNEVVANLANKLHPGLNILPNDDVNRGQSSNDTYPTAMNIVAVEAVDKLEPAIEHLIDELKVKQDKYWKTVKVGRTHLQDATPLTFGQEVSGYISALKHDLAYIQELKPSLYELAIGGTAVGTGLNAAPGMTEAIAGKLSEAYGHEFKVDTNKFWGLAHHSAVSVMHGAFKTLANDMFKIAQDIRFLASGPRAGYGELNIPANEPGSSIMPGKVNPVIAEVLNQVCYQVIGNDLTITLAVENGQFELNVMEPVLAYNLFNNLCYLKNGVNTFVDKLLVDLEVDREQCEYWLNRSVGIVTALLPHLGYETASALAKEAYETGRAIRDIILDQGLLTEDEINHILSPKEMTRPGIAGANLLKQKGN